MIGSTLAAVKAGLHARLAARPALATVEVSYAVPTEADQVDGPGGIRQAVWLDDSAQGEGQVTADGGWHAAQRTLGGTAAIDERYTLRVVCQVIGRDTDDTQAACDTALMTLIGEVVDTVLIDPHLVSSQPAGWPDLALVPSGWTYESGHFQPSGLRGARAVVLIGVTASTC